MPGVEARHRNYRQKYRWRKDHPARGDKPAVVAGQVEEVVTPIWWHICYVCDSPNAPFGHGKRYYCREHDPVLGANG